MTVRADVEVARFHADDIEKVPHEAGHLRGSTPNSIRLSSDPTSYDGLRFDPQKHRSAHGNDGQQVPQVVRDHAEKFVAGPDQLVHAASFEEKALVGPAALYGQQRQEDPGVCLLVLQQLFVGDRPFSAQDGVVALPFVGDAATLREISPVDLRVGNGPSPREDLVGKAAGGGDDGLGVLVQLGRALRQLFVRLAALVAEAAIGALPLRGRMLPRLGHRNCLLSRGGRARQRGGR